MDLLQGTLDVLVLRTLAWGGMHGYAVSRWIRDRTDGTISIEDAPLYKALHRLENARVRGGGVGFVREQPASPLLPVDRRGRRQLRQEEAAWRRYAAAVFKVLEPAS